MKKIIISVLLFVSMTASAQNEVLEDTLAKPVITAVGKPDGTKTAIKINKDGSSLKSSDAMVELNIPEGAIPKNTVISIQPVTNLLVNGNGKAYRLEPSGIQFKKPLQLIFHYDEEEIKDSMQLLLGIAMQDDKGQWYGLKNFDLDTIAKTISGNINHFSVWSSFSQLRINPRYARVKIKKTQRLEITYIAASSRNDDELDPLTTKKIPWRAVWHANEILNGNSAVGTISASGKILATYKAPSIVPDKNPVAVTATLLGIVYRYRGITFENLKLVSNILVYDNAYEVTMISEIQDPGAGTNLGAVTYKDTGSFVVSLNGKEARIIEKVNKNISASLNYSGGCCYNYKILKSGTGNIHIAGRPVIKVIPASAAGKGAWIEISFTRVPSIFPLFQVTCKCSNDKSPSTFTNAKGVAMMAGILPAFPILIKFEAKEEEQTILEQGQPDGPIYAKFTLKQIKEE
jgi:Holliday junction resolvase RusA-like endonuclease